MLPHHKKKAIDALKRLEGLEKKMRLMIEEDAYCPQILELALAMQGHIRHVQAQVLESHLHTCAEKSISSKRDYEAFIAEVINAIGLSKR